MSKLRSREPLPRLEQPGPAPVRELFRRYEQMEREMEGATHTGQSRWMIPYADLLTLLLGFFVVLFAGSRMEIPAKAVTSMDARPESQNVKVAGDNRIKDSENLPIVSHEKADNAAGSPSDMQLAKRLKQEMTSGLNLQGVEIRQQERGLVISLKDSILFAPGSAELSQQARETLDRLTGQLSAAMNGESRPIRVEGHTDNTPITTSRYPSNWELSTARATNIVRYLVAGRRFSPDRLSAAGYGEFKPVDDNSSIEGKQKNRRVDIVILSADAARQEPPAAQAKKVPPTAYPNEIEPEATPETTPDI